MAGSGRNYASRYCEETTACASRAWRAAALRSPHMSTTKPQRLEVVRMALRTCKPSALPATRPRPTAKKTKEGRAMLDLESLFAASPAPAAVPGAIPENVAGNAATNSRNGGSVPATVPTPAGTAKTAESLELRGIEPDSRQPDGGKVGHSGHNGNPLVLGLVCPRKPLQHKAFGGLGTVGTVGTVDFQGGEGQTGDGAPGGGAARERFALNPSAVILALAYCRKVKADNDETVSVLQHLESMQPGEQVRRWHGLCLEVGVKPWEALTIPAPLSGGDCTKCKHLTTRQMASDGERRQFHWACGLGYLVLETGRGAERIWIAPPECSSWERWRPAGWG